MPDALANADLSEIHISGVTVRTCERALHSKTGTVTIEPLVMQLLVTLSRRAGNLVSRRDIFDACWGSRTVGDDSLNRLVAVLRKALTIVAADAIRIETVPGLGYVLRLSRESRSCAERLTDAGEVQVAVQAAFDSWRLGLPEPDYLNLEELRRACALQGSNAEAWGMLSLLCRHAAEYAEPAEVSKYVRECENAARRAIALDPSQPEARTALISVVPLFRRWADARHGLLAILEAHPKNVVAAQDLATLEMATGRVSASKVLRDRLIAQDPLGACYCYKSVYQHWSVGDLEGMDHMADRAIQLWPTHPAVWMARLWTLAYTGRGYAALAMVHDAAIRPNVPARALAFVRRVLIAVTEGASSEADRVAQTSMEFAQTGPANAIVSLFALGLLQRPNEAFAITESYYFRAGSSAVPLHHTDSELSVNEQHRRLTQVLFTPVFARMRSDDRFISICDRMGLCSYWEENEIKPDFLS